MDSGENASRFEHDVSTCIANEWWTIYGVPKDFNNFELLYFNSFAPIGTFQGVYPTMAPNQSERDVILNPIVFSTDNETIDEYEKSKSIVK